MPGVDGFFGGAAEELVTWDPDGAGPLGPWLTAVGRIEVAARTAVTTWRALGWGMPDEVNGLTVHQGLLYATGEFYSAGSVQAQHIAKWNGTEWSAVGSGVGMTPSSTIAPEGYAMLSDGTNLYLGGSFGSIDGVVAGSIARWDGSAWHAVSGMHAGRIHALAKYGDEIAMGGIIGSADSKPARGLVFYGPAGWRTIPAEDWLSGPGYSVTTWNDKLVVGGALSGAGDTPARGIAAWDGSEWQSLGDGVGIPPPLGMTEYMGDLIVVGNLTSAGDATVSGVARWDGTTWNAMGSLKSGSAWPTVCTVYNGELYAAGSLPWPVLGIRRWDGSDWQAVGGGLSGNPVRAMVEYNGELIVAGRTSLPGTSTGSHVLAWNGVIWRIIGALGPPRDPGPYPDPGVYALTVYNGKLIALGNFHGINGSGEYGAAQWDGSTWSSITPATAPAYPYRATCAFVYEGDLYVGQDGVPNLIRWNGAAWSPVGGGVNHKVAGLTEFDGALVAVGDFLTAGGAGSAYWARWRICAADLNCDELVDFSDYLEFLNLYDAQDSRVDFNRDGLVDFADYLEFLNLYDVGC